MRISEIFYSISGEGRNAGIPTVFIRLSGCNLAMNGTPCSYCDSEYAWNPEDGKELSVKEVVERVQGFKKVGWTLITGGEPLWQIEETEKLTRELKRLGYLVEVETNGSIAPPKWYRLVDTWSVDIKCPSSSVCGVSKLDAWNRRKQDGLKFVVGAGEDLQWTKQVIEGIRLKPAVLISPVAGTLLDKREGTVEEYWNREWLQECTEFCKVQNVRLSLQIHKIIYGDKRGV